MNGISIIANWIIMILVWIGVIYRLNRRITVLEEKIRRMERDIPKNN